MPEQRSVTEIYQILCDKRKQVALDLMTDLSNEGKMPEQIELSREVSSSADTLAKLLHSKIQSSCYEETQAMVTNLARAIIAQVREETKDGR
jgi:hypothetical protein